MKEFYPNKRDLWFEICGILILAIFAAVLSFSYERHVDGILIGLFLIAMFAVLILIRIKYFFSKICLDEKGIYYVFRNKIRKQILWEELGRILFVGRNIMFLKGDRLKDRIVFGGYMRFSSILSEYLNKIDREKIGLSILTPKQLAKLGLEKK